MTCDEILSSLRERLKDRNIMTVSKAIGVHYNTVRAIATGKNCNPTLAILRKIEAYLSEA